MCDSRSFNDLNKTFSDVNDQKEIEWNISNAALFKKYFFSKPNFNLLAPYKVDFIWNVF